MGRVEGGNTPPGTMILYKYFPFSGYAGKPHANLGGHETSTKLGDCGQKAQTL